MQVGLSIAILLVAFLIGKFIYIHFFSAKFSENIEAQFLGLYLILMFSWWMYASGHFFQFVYLVNTAMNFDFSSSHQIIIIAQKLNIREYILKLIPFLLYFGLTTIGFLYSISEKSNPKFFAITLSGFCILMVPLILSQTELGGLLGERWLYISQVALSLAAGVGLFISSRFSNRWKQSILFLFIFIMFLLNILNPAANTDNPIMFEKMIIPSALTEGELNSVYFTSSYINNTPIYADVFLYNSLNTKFKIESERIEPIISENKFLETEGFFLVREDILNKQTQKLTRESDYNLISSLNDESLEYMRIYDDSAVQGYLHKSYD